MDSSRTTSDKVAAAMREREKGAHVAISPYVLLFAVLLLAAIATWIIPAGEFDRVVKNGISFVVPHSLKRVPQSGIGPGAIFVAIAHGLIISAPIIFLILFTGGALAILEKTGAVKAALGRIGTGSNVQDASVIFTVCIIFSLLGTVGVVTNSVVAFVPLGLLITRSLRLPAVFGVAFIYLGTYSGFNSAVLNPATTGISQRLAELPMFSGIGFRAVVYLLFVIATIGFLIANVRAYRRNPHASTFLITENDALATAPMEPGAKLTRRQTTAIAFSTLALCTFVFGAVKLHWGEVEMISMFMIIAIGSGLICRMGPTQIADEFLAGSGKLIHGALIVGLARAISTVLSDGKILDPMVNLLSEILAPLHPILAAIGMFLSAAVMHIAISSGSGESAALIPIFAPLGDALHLTRQVTVQAVLLGEGIMNCFNPTSGVLMAVLATARIPFGQWVRFVMPLIFLWGVICILTLIAGVLIHWGPF
ncbi:Arginine/ornithine antiporter ArcD [Collimonas arenae]|uniref:Arginine/ornithine antiporter ArcD n=1 Tax=Collimonas arenae TaxID=279058 RepID=A0A0A1FFV4_9BURK|nr:YfcC family protein [Collimonas arenae]AIY41717.1 Arginine/ornithine antiporter ArcD [Collimonas arenae]